MNLSALSAINQSNESTSQTKKNTLTQEDFFNLFIAQMKYQNPLEPMDNYQMATQMAQFGSLESLNQMTGYLENMAAIQASMGSLQASGLIGKKGRGSRKYLIQRERSGFRSDLSIIEAGEGDHPYL